MPVKPSAHKQGMRAGPASRVTSNEDASRLPKWFRGLRRDGDVRWSSAPCSTPAAEGKYDYEGGAV